MTRITTADLVVIGLLAALGIYLLGLGSEQSASGQLVVIRDTRGRVLTVNLKEAQTLGVDGRLGTTRIETKEGCVRFLSSPCPHKFCVRKGRISKPGEWIVCVPNGVMASVSGEATFDGITP